MTRPPVAPSTARSPGVLVPAAYFFGAGVLEVVIGLRDLAWPWAFWPAWEALGRGLLHGVVGLGLLRRLAICRSIALVYCIAMIVTYGTAIGLAFAGAELRHPGSVVLQSLYIVPSCALLFPHLRSPRTSLLFDRALF